MDKRFWSILAVAALILAGVFILTKGDEAGAPTSSNKGTLTNHVLGKATSGVRLVEYGDFACPACRQYHPIVKQAIAPYGDQIGFQFRHFPITQAHPNAVAGARAAEAADLQGKFWEMHDLLYQNQDSWDGSSNPLSVFLGYAKQLGLDTNKFTTDFKSSFVNDRIQADLREATRLRLTGTPTFFINDKQIESPNSVDAFKKVIDAAIRQKTGKAPITSEAPAEGQPLPAETPAE